MQTAIQTHASPDHLQKKQTIATTGNFITDKHATDTLGWTLRHVLMPHVEDSAFDQIHRPAKVALSNLLRDSQFVALRRELGLPSRALFLVNEAGRLHFSYRNVVSSDDNPGICYVSPQNITSNVTQLTGFPEALSLLANMAKLSGGWVTTGEEILVGQWLTYHGLPLPENETEVRGLLDLLNFSTLPAAPRYANYWQVLDAPDESPFKLDETNRAIIRQVTAELTGGDRSLVALFGAHLILESTSADGRQTSTGYRLQRLLELAVWTSDHAHAYLEALNGYPENGERKPAPELVEQLLIAAMLLDIDPTLDIAKTDFAGFDLYSSGYVRLQPRQVRSYLEQHLVDKLGIDPLFAPLVAELVLGGMAPEYLFSDWPAEVRIGTPAWVVGSQAVHFSESLIPGVSRVTTYQHLLGFSQSTMTTPPLQALQASTSVDPVITWALMNRLIARDSAGNVSRQSIEFATDEYRNYIDKILDAATALTRPLPHRRPLALKELQSQVPDCDPDELLVKVRGSGGGGGAKVSVLDLYLGDELHTGDWNRSRGASIYESYPKLANLYPAEDLYYEAVSGHFTGITQALQSNIEVALSQLHPSTASFMEYAELDVYGIHEYEWKSPSISTHPGVVVPGGARVGNLGRYGVILCARANSEVRCFELFPLRMNCRYNTKLTKFLGPLVLQDFAGIESLGNHKNIGAAPVDVRAYLQNRAPEDVQSKLLLRRIGHFAARTEASDPATPAPCFRSPRKEAIGELVAREVPYLTESEIRQLGLDLTERERAIEKTEAIFDTVLNLIIPFKECVQGLSSGDPKKQGPAILDCVVDVAALFVSFAAAPIKIANLSSKAAVVARKLLAASRVLASTTLAFFNPLDGPILLLKGSGRLLGRGAGKLSGVAISASRQARQQLRHLTGANSYDLLRAIDHTGAASRIRMSLDCVAHARALFKSDLIENAEHVLKYLHADDINRLGNIPEQELSHLFENALTDIALKSDAVTALKRVLEPRVVDSLIKQQAKKYSLANLHQFKDPAVLPELFETTLQIEYRNLQFMQPYQTNLLTRDLGKAPFDSIMDEVKFNPGGLRDDTDRATAWILNASSSRNELESLKKLLAEYSANSKPLNDPAIYTELHRKIVPGAVDGFRSPVSEARYPTNVSGAALLEQHVKLLDPANEQFGKQMLGALLGYHSFVDGNGRTARAIYAISELRKGRFNALGKATEDALSGLN